MGNKLESYLESYTRDRGETRVKRIPLEDFLIVGSDYGLTAEQVIKEAIREIKGYLKSLGNS